MKGVKKARIFKELGSFSAQGDISAYEIAYILDFTSNL